MGERGARAPSHDRRIDGTPAHEHSPGAQQILERSWWIAPGEPQAPAGAPQDERVPASLVPFQWRGRQELFRFVEPSAFGKHVGEEGHRLQWVGRPVVRDLDPIPRVRLGLAERALSVADVRAQRDREAVREQRPVRDAVRGQFVGRPASGGEAVAIGEHVGRERDYGRLGLACRHRGERPLSELGRELGRLPGYARGRRQIGQQPRIAHPLALRRVEDSARGARRRSGRRSVPRAWRR